MRRTANGISRSVRGTTPNGYAALNLQVLEAWESIVDSFAVALGLHTLIVDFTCGQRPLYEQRQRLGAFYVQNGEGRFSAASSSRQRGRGRLVVNGKILKSAAAVQAATARTDAI